MKKSALSILFFYSTQVFASGYGFQVSTDLSQIYGMVQQNVQNIQGQAQKESFHKQKSELQAIKTETEAYNQKLTQIDSVLSKTKSQAIPLAEAKPYDIGSKTAELQQKWMDKKITTLQNKFRDELPEYKSNKFIEEISGWKEHSTPRKQTLTLAEEYTKSLDQLKAKEASLNPELYQYTKKSFETGLDSLGDAAEIAGGHKEGDFNEALQDTKAIHEIGKSILDVAMGLTPGISVGKDAYEALSGKSLIDGSQLDLFDRSFAVLGVVTAGGSNIVKHSMNGLVKIGRAVHADAAFTKSLTLAKQLVEVPMGQAWLKLKNTGSYLTDYGYKVFNREAKISNPFPRDDVFSRVMKRTHALEWLEGKRNFSVGDFGETFVGAYEDIKGVTTRQNLAQKLGLFAEAEGKTLRKLTDEQVIVTFKFVDEHKQSIRSPIEVLSDPRKWGFLPGGRTSGNAREWLVTSDALEKGIIDRASIAIKELPTK